MMSDIEMEVERSFHLPALPRECHSLPFDTIEQWYFPVDKVSAFLVVKDRLRPVLLLLDTQTRRMASLPLTATQSEAIKTMTVAASSAADLKVIPATPETHSMRWRTTHPYQQEERHEFTVKATLGEQGGVPVRCEINIPVDHALRQSVYSDLFKLTHSAVIKKQRFRVSEGGGVWEIDRFISPCAFVKAEYELPSEQSTFPLPPAAWQAKDVTGQAQFSNASIAWSSIPPKPDPAHSK
jgi:CYTH domain-containing protein